MLDRLRVVTNMMKMLPERSAGPNVRGIKLQAAPPKRLCQAIRSMLPGESASCAERLPDSLLAFLIHVRLGCQRIDHGREMHLIPIPQETGNRPERVHASVRVECAKRKREGDVLVASA